MMEDLKKRMKLSVAREIFRTVEETNDGYLFKDRFNEISVKIFMPRDIFEKYNVDYDGMRDFIYELLEEYAKSIEGDVLSFDESVEWIEYQVAMNTDEYEVYHGDLPATSPIADGTVTIHMSERMGEHGESLGSVIEKNHVLDHVDKEKRLCVYRNRGDEKTLYVGFAVQWDVITVPYVDDDLTERKMEITYALTTKDIELRNKALSVIEKISRSMEAENAARALLHDPDNFPFRVPETLREHLVNDDDEFYALVKDVSEREKRGNFDAVEIVKKAVEIVAERADPETKTNILREFAEKILDKLRSQERNVTAKMESVDETRVVMTIKNESTGETKRVEVKFEDLISNFPEPRDISRKIPSFSGPSERREDRDR